MSNQTYAEARGVEPFDWWHALNNPEQYDPHELDNRADSWVTCACGNQCDLLPRSKFGEPDDPELHSLGIAFADQIHNQEWDAAKLVLADIEARSAELIAEIKGE